MGRFVLQTKMKPKGDQPRAIVELVAGLRKGYRDQTLLGITGSGKTFTMANVVAQVQRPTLVISHNKTLAAQLASEFREFFPNNAVHYFVSYYDYYQPEAYQPTTDTYIEKETDINEEIDRLRHAATQALLSRRDVLIVASVSCIYGLGSPAEYARERITLQVGRTVSRREFFNSLTGLQFERNDIDLQRGRFRVKGEIVDIFPIDSESELVRLRFDDTRLERIDVVDSLTGDAVRTATTIDIYPATHHLAPADSLPGIIKQIRAELEERLAVLKKADKLLEAQRLEQRTRQDLEMLATTGYCQGIENYSRFFDGRKAGEPPYTLLDYFSASAKASADQPDDWLLFMDESHMTVPQVRGMIEGDRSRKRTLIQYGFRLPSALDNRPLSYAEFDQKLRQVIYVSATPALYERGRSKQIVEQIIRPTGLLDPDIDVKPTKHQVDDLVEAIRQRVKKHQRVLVTTLTKKMAEELSDFLEDLGIKVHYLHADVETMKRIEILRDLRLGVFDVVVGINLLREGLDLPEVSLVAILDADKEGYLRSDTALIQTMGRAARHVEGHIIMYADKTTGSMRRAIKEVERRRQLQLAYNRTHRITPKSIQKAVRDDRLSGAKRAEEEVAAEIPKDIPATELPHLITMLTGQMDLAARNLDFEKAALLRDQIQLLKQGKVG
ncbi:MAG: excinuclease ABC subunit UvrB [Candidatus Kerfeldbacteria bacterium]|nr:excinuclease ABC subunit UvrB [Candidatus Kerfeldbacteria bacterium]